VIALPKPLGCFALLVGDDAESRAAYREELLPLVGGLAEDPAAVAAYLRSAALAVPIMGIAVDSIDGRHLDLRERRHRGDRRRGAPTAFWSGIGIRTDGAFYWHEYAADYVEHYRVALPTEFIEHMRSQGWMAPAVSEDLLRGLERALVG
jgi:hypothetical protein